MTLDYFRYQALLPQSLLVRFTLGKTAVLCGVLYSSWVLSMGCEVTVQRLLNLAHLFNLFSDVFWYF